MQIKKDIQLLQLKTIQEKDTNQVVFEYEPIAPGYGITLGHALRRVLLSSLKGSAITSVKIEGASHEFSTIKGVKEDTTDIILNLKHLTVKSYSDEPVTIKLSKKGPGIVYAKDFAKNSNIEILDQDYPIATLEKDGKLNIEVVVEQGFGYVPVEKRQNEQHPIGTIAVDAIFNPIRKINYMVDNARVGSNTNYNKLTFDITTNGTITPNEALEKSIEILNTYLVAMMPQSKSAKNQKAKKTVKSTKSVKKTKKTK